MSAKIAEMLSNMGGAAKVVPLEELDEARAFLAWTADKHFTFLGYRDYELSQQNGVEILKIVPKSGLGILREPKLGSEMAC